MLYIPKQHTIDAMSQRMTEDRLMLLTAEATSREQSIGLWHVNRLLRNNACELTATQPASMHSGR